MTSLRDTLAMRTRDAVAAGATGILQISGGLTQVKDFSGSGVILIRYGDKGMTGKAVFRIQTTGRNQRCTR